MTSPVLDRTQEQRMAALEHANEIRTARARLKRAIATGGIDPVATLRYPPDFAATMKVEQLLSSVRGNGPVRVRRIMRWADVSASKTLGGVTERQRGVLADLLARELR